jgi:surface protein
MKEMFYLAEAFNGDLSSWDVSNVTIMEAMFQEAWAFNGDLSSWDVSNVTTMEGMFYEADAFNKNNIKNWDLTGKCTVQMFRHD